MINVYDGEKVIARVKCTQNLDYWDGRNMTCGSTGRHLGITRLADGRFVLVHTTQWQGEQDSAEIVSKEDALQSILRSDNTGLLDEKKYAELNKLYEENMVKEA